MLKCLQVKRYRNDTYLILLINVYQSTLDQPTTTPNITQTPVGPIIEGNKVTLTCIIQGGNPVATITWSCDGPTQITPTRSPSTGEVISSIEFVTSKSNNGEICTCTGRHLLWTVDEKEQHTITVYCKYKIICYMVSWLYVADGVLKLSNS